MSVTVVLYGSRERQKAKAWIDAAPPLARVTLAEPKRSLPQNDKLHAMLTEVAEQVPYHGIKLGVDDLKLVFLDGLKREMRIVPSLDGNGFVNLGRSTSKLSKAEMGDLITLVEAWGAEHGVIFHGPDGQGADA